MLASPAPAGPVLVAFRRFAVMIPMLVLWLCPSAVACAQGGNLGGFGTLGGVEPTGSYPSPQYYMALEIYRSGDLAAAINAFENELRGGRRDIRGRWIDSIPALAMMAECQWQLGNLAAVREHVDHVMQIAIANRGWLGRIDWQGVVQPGVQLATPQYLWSEAQAVRRVPVTDKVMFQSGQPLTEDRLRRGGEIEEVNLRTMDMVEIMRGLALASYRRRVLLGPLAEDDPVADVVLEATKYPADLQLPIGRTLIGSLRTTEYFSRHDDKRVLEDASQYGRFSGAAHPLSPLVMLSQTSVMAGAEKVDAVVPLAIQTVHVAAALEQPELIGEAMQLAAGCCNAQQATMVRQAAITVSTSLVRQSPLAALHSLIAGADASVTAGDLESASRLLADAQAMGSRRDVMQPRLNAYAAYVAARLAAAGGSSIGIAKPTDLDVALDRVAGFALNHRIRSRSLVSMPRVYQLGLIQQAVGSRLGANTSERLLRAYCEDPPVDVWRRDPVDGLAGVMVDRSVAQIARLTLAASGGYAEPFLVASDDMLGTRFLQRLPLGGRVAQLRAMAGFDDRVLDDLTIEMRRQMGREMADLRAAALAAGGGDPAQVEMLEAKACSLALARFPVPRSVPRPLKENNPLADLPARTAMLTFTFVGNQLFGTLSADGKVSMWPVTGASRLSREVGQLLREIGVGKTRGNRLPEDDSWRETAVNLRRVLIPEEVDLASDRFDEVMIVPDGPLWYLPFEILPVGEKDSEAMGDQFAIRYAPTPGLAVRPASTPAVNATIGICADLFFAPRDPEQNEAIVQTLVDAVKDPLRLPQAAETPTSLLGDKVGHLLVASPRAVNPASPLLMSPAPYDQSSPYGTLAAWLRFPVQGPKSVVLCGLRTPVGMGQMGTGDEIFTTLCALHASGVRSVMLSRWAVGGESTATAMRELVQELPFTGMNAAWARARAVLRSAELNPAGEPLLMKAEHSLEGLTGDQPLFWAGYLVSSPNAEEQPQP